MKVLNIVLSILILLLAAVSAVFSYFLFEKRSQLVEGWRKMALTLNQSARELDKGSGTRVGEDLTAEALSHEHYADLDQKLAQLAKQSKDLVKQRDVLAASLAGISNLLEMKNPVAEKKLQEMDSYSTSISGILDGAGAFVVLRNKIADAVVGSARANLRLTLDSAELRAAEPGALGKFTERMNQFGSEHRDFERAFVEIYQLCDGRETLRFTPENFTQALNTGKQAVTDTKEKLDNANRAIAQHNQEIASLDAQIASLNGQIVSVRQALSDKLGQLETLRGALGLGKDDEIPMPWEDGAPEARKLAVGRVIDVSRKYGYILIDLGSESTVPQQLGSEVGRINLAMAKELEMIVSRQELEVPSSEIITKVKITKVGKDCSIAEPIGGQNGTVRIGDKVWFDIK